MFKTDEMEKWQFFKREKEIYVLNVLHLQRLSFQIRSNPVRKHSTPLRHNIGIIGSCRAPLELISTLDNCPFCVLLIFHTLLAEPPSFSPVFLFLHFQQGRVKVALQAGYIFHTPHSALLFSIQP